jgi:hypothetical protein
MNEGNLNALLVGYSWAGKTSFNANSFSQFPSIMSLLIFNHLFGTFFNKF